MEHSRYAVTYGALADLIVLLTWTWVTCLLLLLGGRLNAVIVRKWPTRPGVHHGNLLAGSQETAPAAAPAEIAAPTAASAT